LDDQFHLRKLLCQQLLESSQGTKKQARGEATGAAAPLLSGAIAPSIGITRRWQQRPAENSHLVGKLSPIADFLLRLYTHTKQPDRPDDLESFKI
jgi:hypothetical protein